MIIEKINKYLHNNIIISIYYISFIIIFFYCISSFVEYFQCISFHEDELKYLLSYKAKLQHEGRWINYIFFSILKDTNNYFIGFINIVLFSIFIYNIIKNICVKKYICYILVAGSALIPSIHILNIWSQTLFLSFLFLCISSFIYKKINIFLFFIIFGILFNGLLSNFYYLLILLFINSKENIFKLLFLWILGFIIGFICAEIVTYTITLDFISLDSWRNPNYIHGLNDLIYNLKKSIHGLYKHFIKYSTNTVVMFCLLFYYIKTKKRYYNIILLMFSLLSVYAQAFTCGIDVDIRTSICIFIVPIILLSFLPKNSEIICIILSLVLFSTFYKRDYDLWSYRKIITQEWYDALKKINPNPKDLKGVIMISSRDKFINNTNYLKEKHNHPRDGMNNPLDWLSIAYEYGFRRGNVIIDFPAGNINNYRHILENINFLQCKIYDYSYNKKYLIIKFHDFN